MFAMGIITEARLRGHIVRRRSLLYKINSSILKFLAFDWGMRQREVLCRRPVVSEKLATTRDATRRASHWVDEKI